MAADSEDNERLLTWHAPDSPEDVVGTVVLLQESATESKVCPPARGCTD